MDVDGRWSIRRLNILEDGVIRFMGDLWISDRGNRRRLDAGLRNYEYKKSIYEWILKIRLKMQLGMG